MPNKEECLQHIQRAVNAINAFQQWEAKASIEALALGIQGKKRESGVGRVDDVIILEHLQRESFDMFEEKIFPTGQITPFPDTTSVEQFLDEYRKGLWGMFWQLGELKNTFIVPLCLDEIAELLTCRKSQIKCAIVDLNRKIRRFKDMKQHGTALHDLLIYETTEYNNHDEAEKKEKSLGY